MTTAMAIMAILALLLLVMLALVAAPRAASCAAIGAIAASVLWCAYVSEDEHEFLSPEHVAKVVAECDQMQRVPHVATARSDWKDDGL